MAHNAIHLSQPEQKQRYKVCDFKVIRIFWALCGCYFVSYILHTAVDRVHHLQPLLVAEHSPPQSRAGSGAQHSVWRINLNSSTSQSQQASVGCGGQTSLEAPPPNPGLQGSADTSVSDTTGLLVFYA